MKKIIYVIAAIATLALTACNGCGFKKAEPGVNDSAKVVVQAGKLNVDHVIATDRQAMFAKLSSGDCRWYEAQITFKDYLDEDGSDEIEKIVNVFQVIDQHGESADVTVWYITHTPDTTTITSDSGFWLEDMPLNDEAIKIGFAEAYERVMAVNYPKPHSRHCVLRKEVGPKEANPQYIFGNIRSQLYVDAVTGDVTDKSPSFNAGGFGKPLGEWP
jgi:hypothetical protein